MAKNIPFPYPKSNTSPWEHQQRIWPVLWNTPAYYLAWDMGVGKTKMGIDYSTGINAQKTLVLCPKKAIHVWPKQHGIHSGIPRLIFAPEDMTVEQKYRELEPILRKHNGPVMAVINYEAANRPPLGPTLIGPKKKKRVSKVGLLQKYGWDLIIPDEAHRTKSPGGITSWNLFRTCRVSRRKLFLSGTPMPHSPLDIYGQYRAMNPRIFGTNFTVFRARYAIMGGAMGKQIFGFQNTEELNKLMFTCADQVDLDDVMDLPRSDEYRRFKLPPKITKLYRQLEKEFWIEYNKGEVTIGNALVKILRLAQMARGIVKFDDGREEIIDTTAVDTVADFTLDLAPSEPLVIYTRFKPEMRALKAAIEKTGRTCAELSGSIDQRQDWEDGKFNTLCANIQSGSESIDLTRARYGIYCSTGLKLGDYRQSRRRIRRPGQKKHVKYYHFAAQGTVDIAAQRTFADRKEVINFVLGGLYEYKRTGIRPGTRLISDLELSQIK